MRSFRLSLELEYALIALVVLTLVISIQFDGTSLGLGLSVPRVIAGILCIVFIPGYLLVSAFFPTESSLNIPQRLALSFALSLSMPPIIIFILDGISLPIQLQTILVSVTLLIGIVGAISLFRRWLTPLDQRFLWGLPPIQPSTSRRSIDNVLWIGISIGALLLLGVIGAVILLPEPNASLTEFYILSETGVAASYPNQIMPGASIRFQIVIDNQEAQPMRYDLNIENGDQTIYAADGLEVARGERFQRMVEVRPVDFSQQTLLVFRLYRSGEAVAYRTLRYWIRILPS